MSWRVTLRRVSLRVCTRWISTRRVLRGSAHWRISLRWIRWLSSRVGARLSDVRINRVRHSDRYH